MKTLMAKPSESHHRWYLIDAKDKKLGRLASLIAHYLKGKHKAEYTAHTDVGDYIVLINASQIKVTGDKLNKKIYYHYSGYRSGMKEIPLDVMLEKHPERVIEHAVKGMLPKGSLAHKMLMKLKIYKDSAHPHSAQNPQLLELKELEG